MERHIAEMLSGQKLKSCYTTYSKCQKIRLRPGETSQENACILSVRTGGQFLEVMLLKKARVT